MTRLASLLRMSLGSIVHHTPQASLLYLTRQLTQVRMWQEDKPEGLAADTLEEGWNTVGLVAAGETDMNGWWWRDKRREHTWGVHDSMRQAYVSISSPLHQVQPSSALPVSSTCTTCTCSDGGKRDVYAHVQETCTHMCKRRVRTCAENAH